MLDPTGGPISAPRTGPARMPASYQGVILRSAGEPILDLVPPKDMTPGMRGVCSTSATTTRTTRSTGRSTRARRPRVQLRAGVQDAAARTEAVDIDSELEATKRCTAWTTSGPRSSRRCSRLAAGGWRRFVQLYAGPPTTTTTGTARRPPEEPQLPRRPHRRRSPVCSRT